MIIIFFIKSFLIDKFLKKNNNENLLYVPTINSKTCANYITFQSNLSKKLIILTEIPKIEIESDNVAEIMKKFYNFNKHTINLKIIKKKIRFNWNCFQKRSGIGGFFA